MALLNDPEYIIHALRQKQLLLEDQLSEKVISFSQRIVDDDHGLIPYYLEPQRCYSPDPALNGDFGRFAGGTYRPVKKVGQPVAVRGKRSSPVRDTGTLAYISNEGQTVNLIKTSLSHMNFTTTQEGTHDATTKNEGLETAVQPLEAKRALSKDQSASQQQLPSATPSPRDSSKPGPPTLTVEHGRPRAPSAPPGTTKLLLPTKAKTSQDVAGGKVVGSPESDDDIDFEAIQAESKPGTTMTFQKIGVPKLSDDPRRSSNIARKDPTARKSGHATHPCDAQSTTPLRFSREQRFVTSTHPDLAASHAGGTPTTTPPTISTHLHNMSKTASSPTSPQNQLSPLPREPPRSALTALFAEQQNALANPFGAEYSFFSGKGDLDPIRLRIFFPHSADHKVPISIAVKREATVEETIGYALYEFVVQKKMPLLTTEMSDVIKWSMMIVEDDGSIDDDFPALERTRKIAKFSFDAFALCEATPSQVKANEQTRQRQLSKGGKRADVIPPQNNVVSNPPVANNAAVPVIAVINTTVAAPIPLPPEPPRPQAQPPQILTVATTSTADPETNIPNPSNTGLLSSIPTPASGGTTASSATGSSTGGGGGNNYFLKVHLYSTIEIRHTTTLNVSGERLLSEVLDIVCRKRKLESKDYVLRMSDMKTDLELDKTLESLHGVTELFLLKKEKGASAGDIFLRPPGEEMIPSVDLGPRYMNPNDYSSMYQVYTVYRKLPMFVGRHERVLAIDGDFLHIMPPENRAMFDTIKTSSYHISSVHSCKSSKKAAHHFRLVVYRDRDTKTYDFEGTTATETGEICTKIGYLIQLHRSKN